MFKKIPFSRIKNVPEYVSRKLNEGNVVLGIFISNNQVGRVESFWLTKDSLCHQYTLFPILDDETYATINEGASVDIHDEAEDWFNEKELKEYFGYKSIAFINAADMQNEEHQHWFYSDDKDNAWGPLEIDLIKYFLKCYPKITIYSKSQQAEDDLEYDKRRVTKYGLSDEVAAYIVKELPGMLIDYSDLVIWINHLNKELGENYTEIINVSIKDRNSEVFKKYFNCEYLEKDVFHWR